MEIEFKDQTIEALEQELAKELEIAEQLLKEAEARKKAVRQKIADAKAEKSKLELHKITEVLRNLQHQYGKEFIENVFKELNKKVVLKVRKNRTEEEEWRNFEHLRSRGFTAKNGETFNQKGLKIKASIPAQKTFDPYFTMNPNKYANMYAEWIAKQEAVI